jgi:ankyrin repeat protein
VPLIDVSMRSFVGLCLLALAASEQVFEDSPALTALWQATSDGSTDAFIAQLIANREYGHHRSSDGRGPMFWAYEFKNVDTLALLMHLGVPTDQEDIAGDQPTKFFPDSAEAMAGVFLRCPYPFPHAACPPSLLP